MRANFFKVDRFGNSYQNVVCQDKKGNGYFKGYVDLGGGKLLQIEVQPQTSTGNKGDEIMWARVTKKKAQRPQAGGSW